MNTHYLKRLNASDIGMALNREVEVVNEAQGRRNLLKGIISSGDSVVFYSSCLLLRNKEIRHARERIM